MNNAPNDAKQVFAPWDDPSEKPFLRIHSVSKHFGETRALDDVSLDIYEKEFFALLGPSGCGKSTLLRALAGFEKPTSGQLLLEEKDIADVPVFKRPINMMFQSYALFPHMSVEKNISFGLKQDKLPGDEIADRTSKVMEMLQLSKLARRKPAQLSGGQQQRTALARSLVKRPKLLLLDEPLGALDKKLREQTQFELMDLQEKLSMTFVIVTHDQEEAMTVSSRIAVMNEGKIIQVGTPLEIYESPQTLFVANFIGDINVFEVSITGRSGRTIQAYSSDENSSFVIEDVNNLCPTGKKGQRAHYSIRPEKISIAKHTGSVNDSSAAPADNTCVGEVYDIGYLGSRSVFHVKLDSGTIVTASVNNEQRRQSMAITWYDRVALSWNPSSAVLLP